MCVYDRYSIQIVLYRIGTDAGTTGTTIQVVLYRIGTEKYCNTVILYYVFFNTDDVIISSVKHVSIFLQFYETRCLYGTQCTDQALHLSMRNASVYDEVCLCVCVCVCMCVCVHLLVLTQSLIENNLKSDSVRVVVNSRDEQPCSPHLGNPTAAMATTATEPPFCRCLVGRWGLGEELGRSAVLEVCVEQVWFFFFIVVLFSRFLAIPFCHNCRTVPSLQMI